MLLNINDARALTALAGVPLYRGRNATYVSIHASFVARWLDLAEKEIADAVASKFDRR